MTAPLPPTQPSPGRCLALTVGVVLLAHSGALGAGFVWDDAAIVVQNTLTADLSAWPRYFRSDLWAGTPGEQLGGSGYYRPLMVLSLALERAVFGLDPRIAHAHSLLWHLLGTALAWRIVHRLWGGAGGVWAATVAALVFGLHPIQSEAVIWVAARNDLMAGALGLIALERGLVDVPRPRDRAVALAAGVLAGLAKESVVLLPLLMAALHLARGWSLRARWRDHLPLIGAIGVVILARTAAGIGSATFPPPEGWALLARRSPWLVAQLGAFVVLPWPLSISHVLEYIDRMPLWRAIIGAAAAVGGLSWVALRGSLRDRAGVLWFALCTAPALLSVADKGWLGERYVYLGMLGLGWVLAARARPRWRVGLGGAVVVAVVMLQLRARDWRSDVELWAAAVRDTPSPFAADSLGAVVRIEGDAEAALGWFQVALDDPEPLATACGNLVSAANVTERRWRAVQLAGWARQRGCSGPVFEGHALSALALAGRWDEVQRRVGGVDNDPADRVDAVRAALWLRSGDPRAAEVMAAHDTPEFAARVDLLARVPELALER